MCAGCSPLFAPLGVRRAQSACVPIARNSARFLPQHLPEISKAWVAVIEIEFSRPPRLGDRCVRSLSIEQRPPRPNARMYKTRQKLQQVIEQDHSNRVVACCNVCQRLESGH